MTVYAIHDTTGRLVSVGTIVADPLPKALTAVALTDPDGRALLDGSGLWDQATRAVQPAPPPPDTTDRTAARDALTTLDTIATTGRATDTTIRTLAAQLARLTRLIGG